ncbi:MAG: hypothetical protein QF898_19475 [SAR202 cluster bacterium]|nr:hypothetical protein [SAR202 cluster bacterium]MDP6514834.1 hypothetical protein [SAR202 cluster bacterium]MDP6714612.1 hypothetical protein [SAR202 cluster bacterium]
MPMSVSLPVPTSTPQPTPTNPPTPSVRAAPSAGLPVPPVPLEELIAVSSVIAIGTVSSDEPTIRNIHGRDPLDSSKPDPNFIAVGSIYEITVERYLKGDEGDTLPVVQLESIITNVGGQVTESRRPEADFPMKKGNRYLLFLRPHGQAPDLLFGAARPSRWILSSGQARVETPSNFVRANYPDTTDEVEFVARVEAIVRGG